MLSSTVRVDGYVPAPNEDMVIPSNAVTPRYFETLEIPLVEGRLFTAADRADTQKVAVINEAMASRYWPGRRALGGVFRTTTAAYEVIGIVRTGKYRELSEAPLPAFYVCYWQSPRPFATIHVRTAGNPSALAQAVAAEFRRIDPALPLTGLMTMVQWLEWPTLSQRLAGTLLGAFGALALLLSAIGLYAMMSFAVSQRTREVGERMALGARPADIWWMILRDGEQLAAIGTVLGLAGALLLMPRPSTLLIDVGTRDVLTLAAVSALLAVAGVAASVLPAPASCTTMG